MTRNAAKYSSNSWSRGHRTLAGTMLLSGNTQHLMVPTGINAVVAGKSTVAQAVAWPAPSSHR